MSDLAKRLETLSNILNVVVVIALVANLTQLYSWLTHTITQFVETGKFFRNSAGPDPRNAKRAIARVIPEATETLHNSLDEIEIEIVSVYSAT